MNEVFCPLPWSHLATKANGDMRVCCQAHQGPSNGLLRDENGVKYNLNRNKIHDARNAPLAKEIRAALLRGEKHPECKRCWDEEVFRIRSKRLQTLEYYNNYEEAVAITQSDGTIPQNHPFNDFDLRLGNLCNLKCRMCAPSDSSMWYDDWHKLNGETFDDTGFDWYMNEEFWRDMESELSKSDVKRFYIVGGEPTLIQKHFDFLQRCVESGQAKEIFLEYATNVTNIHQKFIDIWKEFKGIHIGCSVDGVGSVNDYSRFPSKWRVIERNLKKLADMRSDRVSVVMATTVTALNIYYLDDIFKWNLDNHNFVISLHPLYRPEHLNVKILPMSAKLAVAEKLRKSYDYIRANASYEPYPWAKITGNSEWRRDRSSSRIIRDIEGYIEFMMSEDKSDKLQKFWDVTTMLDELRGESIETSLPELFDLIRDTEFQDMQRSRHDKAATG